MDALERAALKEQRKARRQWKRLNLPAYIDKVRSYKQRCKDLSQLDKNNAFASKIDAELNDKYGFGTTTLSCDTSVKASTPTTSYSDQVVLNILFFSCDLYSISDAKISEIFEDLRRWSYTPSLSGCDPADTLFSRFWQLAREYEMEFGPYDEDIVDDVLAYYEQTKHQQRPSPVVQVTTPRERHPDCDPDFCSDDILCDLCQESAFSVSIPTNEMETDEDVFLDCLDSFEDPIEQDFALASVKVEPEQALILAGSQLSMPEGRVNHIADKLTVLTHQAALQFSLSAMDMTPEQRINIYIMRRLRKYTTRHRVSASMYLLRIISRQMARRPSGLWKDHPPDETKRSSAFLRMPIG